MAMTDQEILRKAAQIRAARRHRTEKRCAVCGKRFEGIAQRRYCSDRCRVAANRARHAQPQEPAAQTQDTMTVVDRMLQRREAIRRREGVLDDSTEILRQQREARSRHLAGL